MMMYDDLIKKLRYCGNAVSCVRCPYWGGCEGSKEDLIKAADAIEELQQIAGHYEEIAKDCFKDVCYYLERVPKWIPVTERLPEDDVFVLNCNDHGNIVIGKIIGGTWWYKYFSYQGQVTHWMPLPEPPKEEEK